MSLEDKDCSPELPHSGAMRKSAGEVSLFPAVVKGQACSVAPVSLRRNRGENSSTQISMFSPVNFEEALDIVQCLRERAATTICVEKMQRRHAERLIDFIAGASAAIDGDFFRMNDHVYLFCPSNIRIVVPGREYTRAVKKTPSPLDIIYPETPSLTGRFDGGGLWRGS